MIRDDITSRRLNIDRKLTGILSLFTVLGVCLLIIIIVISDTMSALRAYSTLQTHWTERRKEASYLFVKYLRDPERETLNQFYDTFTLIDSASVVRAELYSDDTDENKVKRLLLQAHIRPDDVPDMITTFKRFHDFEDFDQAIAAWIRSDRLVDKVRDMAKQASVLAEQNIKVFEQQRSGFITQTMELDKQLTKAQFDLANALGDGNTFLSDLIFIISTSLGFILLSIGWVIAIRFKNSINSWGEALTISEQRYRSLFEQNPNAVFSMTTGGSIIDMNESMKQITGYDEDKLTKMDTVKLFISREQEKIRKIFDEVIQGTPRSFETRWKRINGELIPLYLTYLPIYVNQDIVGVFGIADDISYIKHVERQLKEQLEEKTLLLAEVHDRVKNNLALISSLFQLQVQVNEEGSTNSSLRSTQTRIRSMAMVHERMYHVDSFSTIRIDEYIRELVRTTRQNFEVGNEHDVQVEADPVTMNIKQAIPCGLLLNELVVNAFKFALNGNDQNRLIVRLHRNNDDIFIQVKDNGKGLGKNFVIEEQETMGMTLIQVLTRQLDGKLEIRGENGAEFCLTFKSKQKILQSA